MQNTTTAQAAATPVIERLPTFHTRRSPDMSRVCKRGPFLMRPCNVESWPRDAEDDRVKNVGRVGIGRFHTLSITDHCLVGWQCFVNVFLHTHHSFLL